MALHLLPSDPDLRTVIGRIDDGSLDLQPEFQRGEVWSRVKQRLLIDSILRNWYVPPIHVIRTSDNRQEVLDGQQRLRAIYDFVQGRISVNGDAEPRSDLIESLDGRYYNRLPDSVRRSFDRFTLRVFEIVDYEPEEPYELFYRLNQPTTLTSAEKRNAFFGPARQQIKDLTAFAEDAGMISARIGFSNARMAYEDVVARFVWTLEVGTLREKVTASRVTERYRANEGFASTTLSWAADAIIQTFSVSALDIGQFRLNKATAHSWLCFNARAIARSINVTMSLSDFMLQVELVRLALRNAIVHGGSADIVPSSFDRNLLLVLNDRATARVNDASSVLLRDACLWLLYANTYGSSTIDSRVRGLTAAFDDIASGYDAESALSRAIDVTDWGRLE